MAPRKRKAEDGFKKEEEEATAVSRRVTRNSIRGLESNSVPEVAKNGTKKTKATKKAKTEQTKKLHDTTDVDNTTNGDDKAKAKAKTIVIEHCKQCNRFKTRAFQVKSGLEKGVPGITVILNPEKPRRGCFEIREEGGEKFISLLDMKRPFGPMTALDMEQVIWDIINKING